MVLVVWNLDVAADDLVAARFSEDGQWYRARIVVLANDPSLQVRAPENAQAKIQYIDFGNFEWTNQRE